MNPNNIWQAIKFTLFSFSAGLVQVISFAVFQGILPQLGLTEYAWSYIPSLILSVLWNYVFNRKFTFRSDANIPRSLALIALFYVVFTPASAWWGNKLQAAGWNEWLVQGFNMLVNFVTEFLFQKFVVFRGHIDTAKKK